MAQALAARRLLLVLDTCEHVIDAAAAMAEAVLRAGRRSISSPPAASRCGRKGSSSTRCRRSLCRPRSADDLLDYGAVRLFVERARAAGPDLVRDQHWATTIAAICRRLDGIPLAIEMAAARVAALGIEELAGRLDDRFQLLTGGRRTALPRHQTLRATLDWSHDLLAEPERVILRRLAVFAGAFSLEAAGAVAASAEIASPDVVDGISSLVAKSLVMAEVDATGPRYRLLDTTRAYALEKLDESGERERLARRHAEYYRDLFEQAEAELETRPTAEWLARIRAADRQSARRARLGFLAGRRCGDRRGADGRRGASVDAPVPARGMPQPRRACARRSQGRSRRTSPPREMKLSAALGVSLTLCERHEASRDRRGLDQGAGDRGEA